MVFSSQATYLGVPSIKTVGAHALTPTFRARCFGISQGFLLHH